MVFNHILSPLQLMQTVSFAPVSALSYLSFKVYHAGFGTDVDLMEDMVLQDKAQLTVVQDASQYRWAKMLSKTTTGPFTHIPKAHM